MWNPFKKTKSIGNRKVTRARFLYLYVIFGGISGLGYYIASLIYDLPWVWALSQIYLLAAFVFVRFTYLNWKLFWMYVTDTQQGRLFLYLNGHTHFSEEHKKKLVNWVYLKKNTIRQETRLKVLNSIMDGEELTDEQKGVLKKRSVFCPQQLKDGFSEAMLVNALIYAHKEIQVLDDDLREIMDLTDDHILAFNLNVEMEKINDKKFNKLMEIGKKAASKNKKGNG